MSAERPTPLTPGDERRLLGFIDQEEATHVPSPPTAQTSLLAGLKPGTILGGCRIERLLGQGGMGQVYLAEHLALRKKVAVKVLSAGLFAGPDLFERFEREARLVARLDDPNVIRVLHAGNENGVPFMLLDYVDGESLDRRLQREGALPVDEALAIAAQAARGLSAAHALGIVHRDVKPANILVSREGAVRVADFGLARCALSRSAVTGSGAVLGTPFFMAPEQVAARPVDARTDLYALGVTLYCALTGRLPYRAESAAAALYAVVHTRPDPPSRVAPAIPPQVDDLVMKLLEKAPSARFQTAGLLLEAIDSVRRTLSARPAPPRRRRLLLVLIPAAIAVGLLFAWAPWRRHAAGPPAPPSPAVVPAIPAPDPDRAPELPPAAAWPTGWAVFLESKFDNLDQALPLAPGWVQSRGSLDAVVDAQPMRFPSPSRQFTAEIELEFPEEASSFVLRLGALYDPRGDAYRLTWAPGRSIECVRVPTGKVLLTREAQPADPAVHHRIRFAFTAEDVLLFGVDDEADLSATDPNPLRVRTMAISLCPAGGPVRIRSFRFCVPASDLAEPH